VLALTLAALACSQSPPIAPGDRLVWLGGTLVEQEIRTGDWELEIARAFPGGKIVVRNLGWSGDTLLGEARAGFGSPADGFKALVAQTLALKPTVIWLQYGTNEAFADPLDIAGFRTRYEKLLEALAPAKARIVLVIPPPLEQRPLPLPDAGPANAKLALLAGEIGSIAKARGHGLISLEKLWIDAPAGQTTNGLQMGAGGYRATATAFAKAFGVSSASNSTLVLKAGNQEVVDKVLPNPGQSRLVQVQGLETGKHELLINGEAVASADASQWAMGVPVGKGAPWNQAAKLREAIVTKNMQFFHRWRPQNETYLFGFRKHEQGNNAREIPQFDPFIEKAEAEIDRLSIPSKTQYQIRKVS
jgi:lysophospholipase L1-like esterase